MSRYLDLYPTTPLNYKPTEYTVPPRDYTGRMAQVYCEINWPDYTALNPDATNGLGLTANFSFGVAAMLQVARSIRIDNTDNDNDLYIRADDTRHTIFVPANSLVIENTITSGAKFTIYCAGVSTSQTTVTVYNFEQTPVLIQSSGATSTTQLDQTQLGGYIIPIEYGLLVSRFSNPLPWATTVPWATLSKNINLGPYYPNSSNALLITAMGTDNTSLLNGGASGAFLLNGLYDYIDIVVGGVAHALKDIAVGGQESSCIGSVGTYDGLGVYTGVFIFATPPGASSVYLDFSRVPLSTLPIRQHWANAGLSSAAYSVFSLRGFGPIINATERYGFYGPGRPSNGVSNNGNSTAIAYSSRYMFCASVTYDNGAGLRGVTFEPVSMRDVSTGFYAVSGSGGKLHSHAAGYTGYNSTRSYFYQAYGHAAAFLGI